ANRARARHSMADECTADWVRRMIAEQEAVLADAEAIGDAYAARHAEHELRNYRQFLARLEPQKA
ncbi:hypothetical protein KEM39_10550, partial [Neisseria sp. Marseille-Q1983]|uniref:hypothetical protein n=1 Tax=Neisseria sp. Marseille-Q1983 TaxID=2830768 RepID=UPI001BA90A5B|nr:hypothetical protein [Neisseria sp. Marseille-Q1983]